MGERDRKDDLPPDVLDELITRIERLEKNQAALEGAIRAFIVVFGVRRLPDTTGDGDKT